MRSMYAVRLDWRPKRTAHVRVATAFILLLNIRKNISATISAIRRAMTSLFEYWNVCPYSQSCSANSLVLSVINDSSFHVLESGAPRGGCHDERR